MRNKGKGGIKGKKGLEKEFENHIAWLFIFLAFMAMLYLSIPFIQKTGLAVENITNATENQSLGLEASDNTATVTVNTDSDVGVIRSDFYGANTHGLWLGNGTMIDANSDGNLDTPSDLNWNRQAWLDSGMKYMRWDANLQNYYSNSSDGSVNFTGNLNNRIDQLKWAHQNGIRVLLILDYMPIWLADTSLNGCDSSSSLNLSRCPPYNYTIWQNILVDYLNRLTVNGTYASNVDIEVWNEPDYFAFWLSNLPNDNPQKSVQYNILYNFSYAAIKSSYPSISVGGPSLSWIVYTNLARGFLSNFSNEMDFFSLHRYTDNAYTNLVDDANTLEELCSQYGANCSRIIISEWNTENSAIKNSSQNLSQCRANIALGYTTILDNYPSSFSMLLYQWSEDSKYASTTNYPQYPQRWSMVSEPQLDNAFYPSYNITKDFTHYHATGDMVISSSSNNGNIVVVASKNSSSALDITVISNSATDVNVTINLSGALMNNFNALEDLETGKVYYIINGAANVGILNQYDVDNYESVNVSNIVSNNQNSGGTVTISSSSGGGSSIFLANQNQSKSTNPSNIISSNAAGSEENNNAGGGPEQNSSVTIGNSQSGNGESSAVIANISNWTLAAIALITGIIVLVFVIIYFVTRKKQVPENLIEWIRKGREMGHEDHTLKHLLIKHGLDEEDVNRALNHTKKE